MPAFKLVSDFQPTGDQPQAIEKLVAGLLKDYKHQTLLGATGTGKTFVAFQIIWKLWNKRWNRTGEHRRPRVLYLADRNVLVEDPMSKDFAVFEDARWQIKGRAVKSREIYFATYQAIARDERRVQSSSRVIAEGYHKGLVPHLHKLFFLCRQISD